jgi:hypothetical protein
MTDKKQVMSWLEGLTFDDWHMYHSDSEVQECAKSALSLLKEQEAKQHISDAIHETAKQFRRQIVMCKNCKKRETMYCPFYWRYKGTKYDDWFCADGER